MVFAELKKARGMSRAKLRGITEVQTQAPMAAAAHNILKMARSFQRPLKAAEARASVDSCRPVLWLQTDPCEGLKAVWQQVR